MLEDAWKGSRIDRQGFESTNMWDYQGERVINNFAVSEVQFYRGRLRTLDVGVGLVDVREIKSGPQRRTGYERFPPATACMGQHHGDLIRVTFATVVRDE